MVQSNDKSRKGAGSNPDLPDKAAVFSDAVVLIVEPDAALRQDAEDQLRAAGFAKVFSAPDEEGASKACASTPPDVMLLQADLDSGSGKGIVERLRAIDTGHRLSIIFLSSDRDPESHEALIGRGDDCLALPRDAAALPQRVTTHAMLHVLERTLRAERTTMEDIIAKRTNRLNKALDLLRDAERRLEAELSQAKTETRERIDYFAETQHELRTPLNAICGMSDAMRNEVLGAIDNPKYKEYANNIYQSGQHLLSIIDSRLELSRIEAGADPLEIEEVDVSGVIEETTDMLGRIAEKADVELKLDIEPNLPTLQTDRRKLRQILVNLVSNAIKFTPEKGRVTLSVKRNAQKGILVLVVSDTGIGMSATEMRDVMKPYRRLSGDRRSGERGTGLGLSIVHKLVETLGATIEIESTPGRGTSVKIELPMTVPGQALPKSAVG
jgi:signal transduction histidine kinase